MIVPGANIGVTDYVVIAGVPAAPASITAILYRWVGATRSASGVAVSVATTATVGEYKFTWQNSDEWAITDDLELVVMPVVDDVTYAAVVWRSHGDVNFEQLTYIAAQAAKLTTATVNIIDSVLPGNTIRTFLWDDDVGTHRIPVTADDPGGLLKTYLQSEAVSAIGFGAGRNSVPDLILGSIDKNSITGPDVNDVITIPVTITAADKNAREGTFTWQIRVTDADGNHTKLQGPLILRPNYRTM